MFKESKERAQASSATYKNNGPRRVCWRTVVQIRFSEQGKTKQKKLPKICWILLVDIRNKTTNRVGVLRTEHVMYMSLAALAEP